MKTYIFSFFLLLFTLGVFNTPFAGAQTVYPTVNFMGYAGNYSAGSTYGIGDVVFYNGINYLAKQGTNKGNTPDAVSSVWWTPLSQSGVQIGGDVCGTLTAPLLCGIRGVSVSATAPVNGQTLVYNGFQYVPTTPSGGSGGSGPIGPAGPTGATGPTGPVGPAGPTGAAATFMLTAPKKYYALGDSITCGYVTGGPYTDCIPADSYASVIASYLNLTLTNGAYPGDMACDLWPRDIVGGSMSVALSGGPYVSTMMIGTNDGNTFGIGAYETTYKRCALAVAAWQAIPAEAKAASASATLGSGWAATTGALGAIATSSTAGSTATFSLTTYGQPILLWYGLSDTTAGTLSYAIDGGSPVSVNVVPTTAMNTNAGTHNSVGVAVSGVVSGTALLPVTHSVVVTNVSGSTSVVAVGTAPANGYASHPYLVIGDIPDAGPGGPMTTSIQNAYSADAQSIAAQLAGYGLDVRFQSNHSYLLGMATEYQSDEQHPNPLGALHIAQAFEQGMQAVPASASSSAGAALTYLDCGASCSPTLTTGAVYITGNSTTVTLPILPPNSSSSIGPVYSITVTCVYSFTGCSVVVPPGSVGPGGAAYGMLTTSNVAGAPTVSLATGHSATFSGYITPTGANWIVTGSN